MNTNDYLLLGWQLEGYDMIGFSIRGRYVYPVDSRGVPERGAVDAYYGIDSDGAREAMQDAVA